MKRNYLVYKLQCPVNGKIYIGVTCQRPEFRWRNGKKYSGDLKADIEKYGWESFSKEILETGLLTAEAAKREKEYIEKYSAKAVLYNATAGGEVRLDCDIDRMAEKMRGRKLTPLAKERMSKARKGIVFSDSHREHWSVSHLGNPGYWTGKKRDAETMKKISKKLSKQIRCRETGEIFANLSDASRKTGYPISCISKWCNGVKPRKCKLTFERIGENG